MILSNTQQATEFLPSLNLSVDNNRLVSFFRRAQAWLVSHIIGEDIEELLEIDIPDGDTDDHKDLRKLCQCVIAERALLEAAPEMDMQLTEAGFAVQQNSNFVPASAQRVDRLLAKMPERIAADVDALVRFLMKHSTADEPYDDWRGTDQFKYLTAVFITTCEEYTALCNGLPNGKKTAMDFDEFYNIIPLMARELREMADYYVSRAEIDRLVELYRDNELLDIHRKAIVNLKDAAMAALRYDMKRARNSAILARDVMMSDPDSFPAFKASPAYNTPTIDLNGGNFVNML